MWYSLLKWVSLSLSLDTRAVVLFLRLWAPFFAGEQCDISPLPSFSLFSLGYFIAGNKDEMWGLLGLFLQHHCGALSTKSPPGKRQWWEEKWVCNPLLLCFSTSDTCVKVKTCSDSRLCIIHLCPGLSSHLIKPQLASGSDMPKTALALLFYPSFSLSFCYLPLLSKNYHLLWSSGQKLQKCKPQMKDEQS